MMGSVPQDLRTLLHSVYGEHSTLALMRRAVTGLAGNGWANAFGHS
jgi:hypothetical protein